MHLTFVQALILLHRLPLQYDAGDNEIEDIEAGLLEPTLYPRTQVAPSSQSITQNESRGADAGEAYEWEILKSIVYGGLIESITSLGVVSSAAGAGADTGKFSLFFPSLQIAANGLSRCHIQSSLISYIYSLE